MSELKIPPSNLEAEKSVIGAILIDEEAIFKIADTLHAENFYDRRHKLIFAAMLDLYSQQQAIDLLTLTALLQKNKTLNEIGSVYISDIVEAVPTASHVEEYAKIIKDADIRRGMISFAAEVEELAYKESEDLEIILDTAERKLLSIAETNAKEDFVHISTLLEESYKRAEELSKNPGKLRGIPTGFKFLDNLIGGLQDSDLIILAARPSVGKTAFVLDIARHAAVKEGKTVGVFNLEMSDAQLMDRLLAMEVNVGLWELRMGRIGDDVFSRLGDAMGILSEAKLYIDDTPGLNIMEMRTKARRLKVEKGLDLLIVDYLQLISGRKQENRVQEVSEISRFLKNLARELDIPVIAVSQLSRAVEQRNDNKPQLSDLRDSGSIEQDADLVIFLSRIDADQAGNNKRLLTVAKHRNGPTGEQELFFVEKQARFREIDRAPQHE